MENMKSKKRLIELIRYCTSCEECRDEDIADHLLANGVKVIDKANTPALVKKGFYHDDSVGWYLALQQRWCEEDWFLCLTLPQEVTSGWRRWIPVTERLPEVGGSYIVVVKYKYDHEKEYDYDVDVATYYPYDNQDAYIDKRWDTYVDWDEGQQYIHITHWMPLPSPPEEVAQ